MSAVSAEAHVRAARLGELALLHLQSGDRLRAVDLCREALVLDRTCNAAHEVLASVALSGEDYLTMLGRIHRHLQPRAYLEIGVGEGTSLALVDDGTLAIGVDPDPQPAFALPASVRIVRESSDQFFATRDVSAEYGGQPPDLVFIDGLHQFEQALRDFINVERVSAPHTVVLVHDCYPLDELTAARERVTRFWSGDVWKLVVCLRKYRPDLSIHTLSALPTGLALIRGLDRGSRLLPDRMDVLYGEFVPMPYSVLEPDKRAALNLVPSDWNTVRALLG